MALHKVTIRKRWEAVTGNEWVNVYNIEALGPNSAIDAGETIAGYEMAVSPASVHVVRITAQAVTGGAVVQRAVDIAGALTVDPVNMVPLFNTVRVVLTDEVGRSESKYLRALIAEANLDGINITNELQDAVQDGYATPLIAVLGLRGPSGETISAASTQKLVQMRQIGWSRRSRPGFHRGYVPNV